MKGILLVAIRESRGLLSSRWTLQQIIAEQSTTGLTSAGGKRLREARQSWQRAGIAVNLILEST
jgi:hypothetical protein